MTRRYKIADHLHPEIAAAVVRHDDWRDRSTGWFNAMGQEMTRPDPRTKIPLPTPPDQEEGEDACPLGLYLWLDPDTENVVPHDAPLSAITVPDALRFAAILLGISHEIDDDEGLVASVPYEKIGAFNAINDAANEFIRDWDAGVIPVTDLDVAWGLRQP